jgi:5-methylcytosine-specific restriction protein A
MYSFAIGSQYSRKDIYRIIGIPVNTKGGNWDTGYNKFKDDYFIFANVGIAGRTGHNYANKFIGNYFRWYAKKGTNINQPQINELLNPLGYIYIFFRNDNSHPFTFAGTGLPISHKDLSPVEITWKLLNDFTDIPLSQREVNLIKEGDFSEIQSKVYERNPLARKICIAHYGYSCQICGFSFRDKYGNLGNEFIHVHHIKPLTKKTKTDPIKELRPLCPNCHAMIHKKKPPYTIKEMKEIIKKNK